jgi:radical SAM protein with 4Fe4S-binding SPASM domain
MSGTAGLPQGPEIDPALLETRRLDTLMVEVTSTCNLRCGFCTKAQPGDDKLPGRDEEMDVRLIPAVRQVIEEFRPPEVLTSGTGETTFRKDWIGFVDALRLPGIRYNLNTNLSLDYADADLEAICELDAVVVSIDSHDRETMRRLRSKCDLRKIAFNMVTLRTKVRGRARRPQFVVNFTLTNLNASHVYETWKFCSELGFGVFVLSDLIEIDHAKRILGIAKWNALASEARRDLVKQINRILVESKQGGARVQLQQSLRQELQDAMNGTAPADATAALTPGQTRGCSQPWRRVTIAADGAVYPCCVTAPELVMGNVNDPHFSLNGPAMRALRRSLLEGQPPAICQGCTNAPKDDANRFAARIRAMLARDLGAPAASAL